jgi:hypothetical protein
MLEVMRTQIIGRRCCVAAILSLLATACSPTAGSGTMNETVDVPAGQVTMEAQLSVSRYANGEPKALDVRYRVNNGSERPIGLLNVAATALVDPTLARFIITAAGDLTITFDMEPRQARRTAVPQTVYAAPVGAGDDYEQELLLPLLTAYPDQDDSSAMVRPVRARFCQAYAAYSQSRFARMDEHPDVWLARPGVRTEQKTLCSRWITLRFT